MSIFSQNAQKQGIAGGRFRPDALEADGENASRFKRLWDSSRGRTIRAALALASVPIVWAGGAQITHAVGLGASGFLLLRSMFSLPMVWGAVKYRNRKARNQYGSSALDPSFSWKDMDPAKRTRARRLIFGLAAVMGLQGMLMTAALTTMAPAAAIIIMQMDTIPIMIRSLLKKENKLSRREKFRKLALTAGVLGGAVLTLGIGGIAPVSLAGIGFALGGMAASATRQILMPRLTGREFGIPSEKVLIPVNAIDLGIGAAAVAITGGLAALNPLTIASAGQWLGMAAVSAAATWGFYAGGKYVRAPQNGVQPAGTFSPWTNSAMLTLQVPATAAIGMVLGQAVPLLGFGGVAVTAGSMAVLARDEVTKALPRSGSAPSKTVLGEASARMLERDAGYIDFARLPGKAERNVERNAERNAEHSIGRTVALRSDFAERLQDAVMRDAAIDTARVSKTPALVVVEEPSVAKPLVDTAGPSVSSEDLATGLAQAWSRNPELRPGNFSVDRVHRVNASRQGLQHEGVASPEAANSPSVGF
ncbi:MAG: hypothetical protein ACOYN3_02135 [Acidimicrobiia bacterium]